MNKFLKILVILNRKNLEDRLIVGVDCARDLKLEINDDYRYWVHNSLFDKFIGSRNKPFNTFENELFEIDEQTKIFKMIFREFIVFCVLVNEDSDLTNWKLISFTSVIEIAKYLNEFIYGFFDPNAEFPKKEVKDCENCSEKKMCLSKVIIDVISINNNDQS